MFTRQKRSPALARLAPRALLFILVALLAPQPAQAAPTFTVNSTLDEADVNPGNGICRSSSNVCTLRAAVMEANKTNGATIIVPVGDYVLTIPFSGVSKDDSTGSLKALSSMTITGAGEGTTIVDGNGTVTGDQVVAVFPGTPAVSVTISGMTIRGGRAGYGGGIHNGATLNLNSVDVTSNSSTGGNGGGIDNLYGVLNLNHSIVEFNQASNYGGGITNYDGQVNLIYSSVNNNTAAVPAGGIFNEPDGLALTQVLTSTVANNLANVGVGGGILNSSGHIVVIGSTLSGNGAKGGVGNGGAISNVGNGVIHPTVLMSNSTISGNNADIHGGGFHNVTGGVISLYNVTVTNNSADADLNGTGLGGGIYNSNNSTFNFANTILALNYESLSNQKIYGECFGTLTSQGNNIMFQYNTTNCTVTGAVTVADPKLGPLQNNGGTTQTHALLRASPARDTGYSGGCSDFNGPLASDQRGSPRPFPVGGRCDIGAYEFGFWLDMPMIER